MCVAVESLSESNSCPLDVSLRNAVDLLRAAVAHVVYAERRAKRPVAAHCAPAWRSLSHSTYAPDRSRDIPRPTRGTTHNRIAAMSPTRERTSRAQNRIRFLDNSLWICETPTWRCREHTRSPRRHGVRDRAFNLFGGRKGIRSHGQRPRKWMLQLGTPVSELGYDLRESPASRGST